MSASKGQIDMWHARREGGGHFFFHVLERVFSKKKLRFPPDVFPKQKDTNDVSPYMDLCDGLAAILLTSPPFHP